MTKMTTCPIVANNSNQGQMTRTEYLDSMFQADYVEMVENEDKSDIFDINLFASEELKELSQRNRNNLANIGQPECKRLLTSLIKRGNKLAGLFKSIVDLESSYIACCRYYFAAARYSYGYVKAYNKMMSAFVKACQEYDPGTISLYRYIIQGKFAFECVLVAEIPFLGRIIYFTNTTAITSPMIKSISTLPADIDLNPGGNQTIIENALMKQFRTEILSKYSDMALKRKQQLDCFYSFLGAFEGGDKTKQFVDNASKINLACNLNGKDSYINVGSIYKRHREIYEPLSPSVEIEIRPSSGFYCLMINTKDILRRKEIDDYIKSLHRKLRTYPWYLWCGVNNLETEIFIVCYLPQKFGTQRELLIDQALLYSIVGSILSDKMVIHINQLFPNILKIEYNYRIAFGALTVNGDFDSLGMKDRFKSEKEYYTYLRSHGQLNSNIMKIMKLDEYNDEYNEEMSDCKNIRIEQDIDDWLTMFAEPLVRPVQLTSKHNDEPDNEFTIEFAEQFDRFDQTTLESRQNNDDDLIIALVESLNGSKDTTHNERQTDDSTVMQQYSVEKTYMQQHEHHGRQNYNSSFTWYADCSSMMLPKIKLNCFLKNCKMLSYRRQSASRKQTPRVKAPNTFYRLILFSGKSPPIQC